MLDRALGLRPGAAVTLLTATGPARYTVTGTIAGPGFFLADPVAARLAGGVRVIGLVTAPGADLAAVRSAASTIVGGNGHVLSGAGRADLEPQRDARTRWIGSQVLTAMAGLAGFVSIFVVASTFAFAVAQRRREFGLLRTIGATPAQVRKLMYGEALVVGAGAGVLGALLGAAVAPAFGGLLVEAGFEPAGFQVRLVAWPPAAAFGVGLVVALLGVWSASRRAGRVRPLEALREAAVDRRPMSRTRWAGGIACTGGGLLLSVLLAGADADSIVNFTLYAAMALTVGLTLLAPVIVPPVVYAVTWPLSRLPGATGMLVRSNALTAVRRTASTAAPMLVTIGFAVLISGSVATTTASYAAGGAETIRAGAVLTPSGTPGLSDAAVATVPGTALLPTTVYGGDGAVPIAAAGIDPDGFARVNGRLAVLDGSFAELSGPDTVVVEAGTASRFGWSVGDSAPVGYADGTSGSVRVVALVADGSVPVPMLLRRDAVRSHDPSALTEAVFTPAAGHPGANLPGELGARLVGVADYAASRDAEEDRLVWIFTLILIGISAGYTALAVANTLLMATGHRTRDFFVLLRAGATIRQVLGTVAAESVLVVGIGTVLGLLVPAVALPALRSALAEQAGAPVALVVPWSTIAAVLAVCLALALAASVLPARLALRVGPGGGIVNRVE